jgi:hypothetical protein
VAEELPSADAGETTSQPPDLEVSGAGDGSDTAPEAAESPGDEPPE